MNADGYVVTIEGIETPNGIIPLSRSQARMVANTVLGMFPRATVHVQEGSPNSKGTGVILTGSSMKQTEVLSPRF